MPRIFFILFLLLLTVNPVFADVEEDIREFNTKGLPFSGAANVNGIDVSITPTADTNTSFEYNLAEQTEETPRDFRVWFQKIVDFFKELFGTGVTDEGNRSAQNFYNKWLPMGYGERELSRLNISTELALNNNINVLGTTPGVSNQAMEYALSCARCAELPYGQCNCSPEEPTPTATEVTQGADLSEFESEYTLPEPPLSCIKNLGHTYITSPQTLPSICYEIPDKNNSRDWGVGNKEFSNGVCRFPRRGFCSPDCLLPFFDNDPRSAEKASMICWRESQGDPTAINNGCFDGITNEYSIGLFQINLKNEEYNPFSGDPRSYHCHGAVVSTGGISCKAGPNIDFCTRKFQQAEINIPEAWNLYYDREIYYTSIELNKMCTVFGGGLKHIWGAWATSGPGDCGIIYERKK